MKTYSLVNPYITGSMNKTTQAGNKLEAAKTLYTKLAKYFKNNVPIFYYSILENNDKLHHFQVKEHKSGKEVNYTISPAEMESTQEKKLLTVVRKKQEDEEQEGGKKKEKFLKDDDESDSDSDSDDDDDYYSPRRVPYYIDPIREFLYNPYYVYTIPDTYIIDYPYTYLPSLALDNGYIITYGY